jgi:hypothetical protein
MKPLARRFVGLAVAIVLGQFFYLRIHEGWMSYWLLKDNQQGTAEVTGNDWGGHGRVDYIYAVNHQQYAGVSGKNWKDPRSDSVQPGNKTIVYYSASHPWISALYVPDTMIAGWPVIIIASLIELIAIITIVKPGSNWAFDLSDKKR